MGFANPSVGSWGSHDACVHFNIDGKVYAGGQVILDSYDTNKWYLVRVEANFEKWLMDVYIDGNLVAKDITAVGDYSPTSGARYSCLNLESLWESAPGIYYDDVKVFSINNDETSIPEFPSIAVPVAAILGLVVIFGRKKNMV